LLGAILYVLACLVLDVVVFHNNTHQIDVVLSNRLHSLQRIDVNTAPNGPVGNSSDPTTLPSSSGNEEVGGLPVMVWLVPATGSAVPQEAGIPVLPRNFANVRGPLTAGIGTIQLRLLGGPTVSQGGWIVVGASTGDVTHDIGTLLLAEGALGPFVLAMLFLATLVIGRRAVGPVEALRRAQLDFTADASHELRTPLSVIEAEVGLALSAPRDAEALTAALRNVSAETGRLRRIVDDLLWLARFEQRPGPPPDEPVELRSIVEASTRRFAPIARSKSIDLTVGGDGSDVIIDAPAEWLDRLVTVLVDNACRYAGEGGKVELSVSGANGSAVLTVDDSGPGIPEAERERVLERFHRSTTMPGGAGLGLAIADAVVSATSGRWQIGAAPAGGARVQVTWHRK
jgi:signal transduction histidine kinase